MHAVTTGQSAKLEAMENRCLIPKTMSFVVPFLPMISRGWSILTFAPYQGEFCEHAIKVKLSKPGYTDALLDKCT